MPTAPPPSAPAPTATPKAAPAPAPASKPALKPVDNPIIPAETANDFNDAFAELDTMAGNKPKPQPKKEAAKETAKKESTPAEEEGAAGVDSTVADGTPSEPDKDGSATNATKPTEQKPVKAKELRDAYEGLKKKFKEEYEPKIKRLPELEAKLKEYETKNPEAEKAAQERIQAIEKRNAELESEIRFSNYKKTKEYQTHEASLNEAWSDAAAKLNGINVSTRNAEGDVAERALTMEDIQTYGRMEPKDRWAKLRSDIPDPAERTTVINHIDKIIDASVRITNAEKKAKEDAETHAKTQTEQQQEFQKNRVKFWRESNEQFAKQHPQWFAKVENDNDGNKLLDSGTALADLLFSPEDLTPERISLLPKSIQSQIADKKPFTQQQVVKLQSIIRNKAANHDRMVVRLKAKDARIAELEKSLKEFEDSTPDNVRAGTVNGAKSDTLSYEAELDAIAAKGLRR